jgi:hypothetical protein
MGGLALALLTILWWTFFSGLPLMERLGAPVLIALSLIATHPLLHGSISGAGMGMLFPILAIPPLSFVLVGWAIVSRRWKSAFRSAILAIAILLATAAWTLIRTEGLNNEGESDFRWRWTKSPEEQLLARSNDESRTLQSTTANAPAPEWPGFRGRRRDGIVHNTKINPDWSASPPVQLWRQRIGPAWSSFAVQGSLFYTQEQRGEDEIVACYNVADGTAVWKHREKARFWESNAGAGPRATPTLYNERLFALGATGILNVLQATDGRQVWSRHVAKESNTKTPIWGFAGSPLIVNDLVIVAAAGSLVAYDIGSGDLRWSIPAGGDCYSSPQLFTICGIPQILLQNEAGIIGVNPVDGKQLWAHSWPGQPIVQPAMTADGDLLVSVSDRSGIRRLALTPGPDGWAVQQRWTSVYIKPYFNDSIIHNGCVFGFDGPALACLDVLTGARKWKGGRYGRGQIILLADQDLLLVLSEKGELALVDAKPEQFKERSRCPGIQGKTWNHPVLVNDILLVRNAQEMAAFRLSLLGA